LGGFRPPPMLLPPMLLPKGLAPLLLLLPANRGTFEVRVVRGSTNNFENRVNAWLIPTTGAQQIRFRGRFYQFKRKRLS
jgi:hypothetical protein